MDWPNKLIAVARQKTKLSSGFAGKYYEA